MRIGLCVADSALWIPDSTAWIPDSTHWIPISTPWIPDFRLPLLPPRQLQFLLFVDVLEANRTVLVAVDFDTRASRRNG